MGKDAPEAPDPYQTAEAQTQANIRTAEEQRRLAMIGQENPLYSVQYVADPSSPGGYRAVTQLSPEQQALLGQSQDIQGLYGDIAGQQLGRVGDVMANPFDMSAARGTEISDIQRTFLDPVWQGREEALKTDLMNRGIREGSDQWADATRDFGTSRDSAYDRMFLDAYTTANQAALTERNQPMAELAALRSGYMPQTPGVPQVQTPTPGVAPTDVAGLVQNNYKNEVDMYNAGKGGAFGLGAAGLGGWAQSGFKGLPAIMSALPFSDRRVKTDIRKIADDPRGWGVYLFRYIVDKLKGPAKWQLGYMADEVERVRPDAVVTDPQFGTKRVDYGALAEA